MKIIRRFSRLSGSGKTRSSVTAAPIRSAGALWAEDEARLIADVTDTIERHEGRRPRGWMGPMMSESAGTPELLKKAGYEFIMDWPCDDQPIWMRTDEGSLMVVPYPIEINDLPQILYLHQNAAEFTTILVDQFEEMLRQSERQPLVCAVSLHTNVMGQPHRIHRLRDALERILAHPDFDRVWVTRPGEIYDSAARCRRTWSPAAECPAEDSKSTNGGDHAQVPGRVRHRRDLHGFRAPRPGHRVTSSSENASATPRDPSEGMMTGLEALKSQAGDYFPAITQIAHASTLVANAVIERKGARCALLCTKGFRDVLEVRRHVRVTTYELWSDPPEPLVPRYLRLPIDERVYSGGEVAKPVDPGEIAGVAEDLKAEGVESVAIAFLHAYRNPANEQAAQRLLAEHLPGIPITTSAAVLPQIKEYGGPARRW